MLHVCDHPGIFALPHSAVEVQQCVIVAFYDHSHLLLMQFYAVTSCLSPYIAVL